MSSLQRITSRKAIRRTIKKTLALTSSPKRRQASDMCQGRVSTKCQQCVKIKRNKFLDTYLQDAASCKLCLQSTNAGVCFYFCNKHKENFAFIPPIEIASHSPGFNFLAPTWKTINPGDDSFTNALWNLRKLHLPSAGPYAAVVLAASMRSCSWLWINSHGQDVDGDQMDKIYLAKINISTGFRIFRVQVPARKAGL